MVNAYADTIDGGGGTNTAVFSGNYASYTTGPGAGGTYTVTLNGVTDTLRNIQSMRNSPTRPSPFPTHPRP